MITVNDWAEIRRLHAAEGLSQRAIAKRLGVSPTTVSRALASPTPRTYSRPPGPSEFDDVKYWVVELLREFPDMPATVLAERVGWAGSDSWFRKRVADLRPETRPVDPADRLTYQPGDQMQCDVWFPPAKIPLGYGQWGSPPVLVMVASFSRCTGGIMLPSRSTGDLLSGTWSLIRDYFQAVPKRLIWDNEAGIGRRGKLAGGVPGLQGTLATRFVQLKPFDPESKGIAWRMNGFLETSFMPGRTFTSPADFNQQLSGWLEGANSRRHATLKARPVDLWADDLANMLALPPVDPVVGTRGQSRLGRDYYLRVASNDYSVDPGLIGRMVTWEANLDQVVVSHEGKTVTTHPRSWTSGVTITDPEHVTKAATLRHQFQTPKVAAGDVLVRDLADYDRLFGVTIGNNAETQHGKAVA
jgi:transcriptional regulator with XRE-family HTH domain